MWREGTIGERRAEAVGDGCIRLRWRASYQVYAVKSTPTTAHSQEETEKRLGFTG
jgi:hypothetical protein